MACYRILQVMILFAVRYGGSELHCKQDDCDESTSKYKELYEPQSSVGDSPYMISPEDFYFRFVAQHRPIVMRKAASNWPARKMWTEEYLIQSSDDGSQVSVIKGIKNFPFGSKINLPIKEFFSRSAQQEDLTLYDMPTNQMLSHITAPLCLRCPQFMKKMKVLFWLQKYQTKASTFLFFHPHEQMLAVVNGSAQVTMVSPLYSEKVPVDDSEPLPISRSNNDIPSTLSSEAIPHLTVALHEGDMLYIPQMWWQHVTLLADHNLFVQFLWPSRMPTNSSGIQNSPKTKADNQPSSMQASLRSLLRKYEERFLTMNVPSLDCPQQDMRMNNYTFEYDKGNPEEIEGPDLTEVQDDRCSFDLGNSQSPCYFEACYEDSSHPECIRYILEYCSQWEDRGCVIELPQHLNKRDKKEMEQITTMESPYH